MFTVPTRIKQIAAASVIGVGLAVAGVALPAQAADPVGAVTYSNFGTSQSGSTITVDFDYAPVDPAAPGTITIDVANFTSCSTTATTTAVIPVAAVGHYHAVQAMTTSNKSFVTLSSTDGAVLVYRETHYQWDHSAASLTTASIVPDADPASGLVSVNAGLDRWGSHFQVEIDGVSTTAIPVIATACSSVAVPYSGLAVGSTLSVFSTEVGHVQLATLTNSAAPVVPPVVPPAGAVNPLTGAAIPGGTGPIDTLAFTGFDGTPYAITSGIALTLGVTFLLWSKRRKAAAAN